MNRFLAQPQATTSILPPLGTLVFGPFLQFLSGLLDTLCLFSVHPPLWMHAPLLSPRSSLSLLACLKYSP